MQELFENFINFFNIFDAVFFLIMTFTIIQCSMKGFSLSFISFMKWVLSLVITVILVPKLQPWVSEYIESEFVNNIGIGLFIFICSLFVIIVIGRALSRVFTWTGLGSIDKSFGLIFGVFKGYVVSICLFSILNWFYPYQNWGIPVEDALTFNFIENGSKVLVEEFPKNKDFIDTKEKLEKI